MRQRKSKKEKANSEKANSEKGKVEEREWERWGVRERARVRKRE